MAEPHPHLSLWRPRRGSSPRSAAFPLAAAAAVAVAAAVSLVNFWPARVPPEPAAVAARPAPRQFPSVELEAASAVVVDLSTGEALFAKDADTARPLASITKLVTALVVRDALPGDAKVTLPGAATEVEDEEPVVAFDASGTPYTYTPPPIVRAVSATLAAKDLLAFTLVASSNRGAEALAKAATKPGDEPFAARMNAYAAKVGMKNSSFQNPTGLDVGAAASARGSARDVATLLGYILRSAPDLLSPTAKKSVSVASSQGTLTATNTDEAVGRLPNLVGGKTGFTDTAGGNLAVVVDPGLNQPVAIVVLGSSKEGRFRDVEALAKATLAYLSPEPVAPAATSTPR